MLLRRQFLAASLVAIATRARAEKPIPGPRSRRARRWC